MRYYWTQLKGCKRSCYSDLSYKKVRQCVCVLRENFVHLDTSFFIFIRMHYEGLLDSS